MTRNKTTNNSTKQIKVTQVGSPIGRDSRQRKTLIGLGLNKMNRSRLLNDTLIIRGMIKKVQHLVSVENITGIIKNENQHIV